MLYPAIRSRTTSGIAAEAAAASLLLAALVFGGGSRGAGDAVVHLFAIPALVLGIVRWRYADASRTQRLFVWWLLAAAALVLLQLLPMPASLIAYLPQRAAVIADLRRAGMDPQWLTPTLDRWGTVRSGLAFATFAAMAMVATTLDSSARRRLLQLACLAAVPMALLGFAQAAAGDASPLRFYDYHHPIGAIGLFANRNHFADMTAMLLPLALAFSANAQARRRPAQAIAWAAVGTVLLLAAALSFSRAGFALAAFATVVTGIGLWSGAAGRRHRLLPLLALAIAALGVAAYAWDGIASRLAQDPLDDLRWQYLRYGREVLSAYWPVGSGFGTFRDVYAPFEPLAAMAGVHALHAHNDLLELLIEGGMLAAALLAAFILLLSGATSSALGRSTGRSDPARLRFAAAVACAIPLLHSLVDYPLRTLAIATLLGLALSELLSTAGRA